MDDSGRAGRIDATVSLVAALADTNSPDEILAVSLRLKALAKLIQEGDGTEWTVTVLNQSYTLVNEALFRAAARAPLFDAATVADVSFEPKTFIRIAMAESD